MGRSFSIWRSSLRAAALVLVGFVVLGPLLGVVIWSFTIRWYWPSALPQEMGLRYWANTLRGGSQVLNSLWVSFWIAVVVVVLSLIISIPAGYAFARFRMPLQKVLLILFLMPQAFPQLPVFINLASVFYRYNLAGTVIGVILVHLVVGLVYSVWIITATFKAVPVDLESAAVNLGASRTRAFFKVALPLALPGIIAASIFVFLQSFDEFTGTYFVGAPFVQTLPILMYTASMGYNMQSASVIAILLTIPAIIFMAIIERFLKAEYIAGMGA